MNGLHRLPVRNLSFEFFCFPVSPARLSKPHFSH